MAVVASLSGVSYVRGGKALLEGIDLTIGEGERWVIVGPNGAGKTTLLKLLSANQHPTTGIVQLLDETMGRVDVFELRPRIGLTSASLSERIPRDERVGNVVVSAAYAVLGRWNERYDVSDLVRAGQLMKQMRVEHLSRRTFGTLSEGERKRVEIARALMTDPELLLLDEPAAGLDIAGRESLVSVMGEIAQDPYAPVMVLVTHHLEEIPPGMTHALLLRDGHIAAAGPISEVLTSERLSDTFGLPLQVTSDAGRWGAHAAAR